jgi:two-component sensor histidine kinase
LSVGWELVSGLLGIQWVETGGPAVEIPASRGFGTRSVIASIESQLGGKAEFDWRPEGLVCRLSVPLSPNQVAPDPAAPREAMAEETSNRRVGQWARP